MLPARPAPPLRDLSARQKRNPPRASTWLWRKRSARLTWAQFNSRHRLALPILEGEVVRVSEPERGHFYDAPHSASRSLGTSPPPGWGRGSAKLGMGGQVGRGGSAKLGLAPKKPRGGKRRARLGFANSQQFNRRHRLDHPTFGGEVVRAGEPERGRAPPIPHSASHSLGTSPPPCGREEAPSLVWVGKVGVGRKR